MLNGSFSARELRSVRWEDLEVEVVVRLKKFGFSFAGGDGGKYTPLSLISLNLYSGGSLISIGVAAFTAASWKPLSVEFRMPLFCS